jgi:regulator of cell morphogenesis and NO signaling
MALPPTATLAELASTYPSLSRELERLVLDYCCGGKRSLEEACRQQGLDLATVVAELSRQPLEDEPPAAWLAMQPAELVDHVEATHHQFLKREMPRLSELAERVIRAHGERHPELIRVAEVFAEIRTDLEPHLRKEEHIIFPMIRTLASASSRPSFDGGSIAKPIAVLEREHSVVGGLLAQLRQLTDGYQAPADTCASTKALMAGLAELEADTHLHVHKENNHLFPTVKALEKQLPREAP